VYVPAGIPSNIRSYTAYMCVYNMVLANPMYLVSVYTPKDVCFQSERVLYNVYWAG
jgi:hypothetical protein